MKKKTALYLIFAPLLIFSSVSVYAQDDAGLEKIERIEKSYSSNEPEWLLIERGRQAFEMGEYGLASRVFREVINRAGVSPDAELWLARIFEKEGEYILAEKQYLKALENRDLFYIHDEQNSALYSLAEIYRKTDQYGMYEKTLLEIIEEEADRIKMIGLQYSILDMLKEEGLDKMFELYRYEADNISKAMTDLGLFYYRTGRYNEAEINLIMPAVSSATTGFNYIYDKTADYQYHDFESHIKKMLSYPELAEYLESNRFFMSMYYLGASLFADGYLKPAEEIWNLVFTCDPSSSTWKVRSGRQLESPFIEPIISHRY